MASVKHFPEGYHSVTPGLTFKNCSTAIDFYKRAFGAEEKFRMKSPDGKIAHCELKIGDSILMLSDECDRSPYKSPQSLGGSTCGLFLYVPDVDASFDRALKAGGTTKMPVADMFWGDRYGQMVDPFGYVWGLATHKEDLKPEEVEKRAQDFFAKMRAA